MGEALHPSVEWAQRSHLVFITINVTDCENPEIKVEKDTLYFKGRGGPGNKLFETNLKLFEEIKKDTVKYTVRPRCIEFTLEKVVKGPTWSRLLADKTKQHWLRPDFSKWKDECSDEDEDKSTNDDECMGEAELQEAKSLFKKKEDEFMDEDKCMDVEKSTGDPPPEDFAEQMFDKIQALWDALLRSEMADNSQLEYFGYVLQELGKIIVDMPRPGQGDLDKFNWLSDTLDNIQKAMGAICGKRVRINQPTRRGEVLHLSGGPKNENNTSALKQIPDDKLENFYKYQYYSLEVQKTKLEWDCLVILPQYKTVINIEVKLGSKHFGNKLDLLEHAAKQTEKHNDYFHKVFGPTLSEGWKFVRAACVPYLTVSENYYKPCSNCKQYILKEKDIYDFSMQFYRILNNFDAVSEEKYKVEYNKIISGIIGYSSLNRCDKLAKVIVDPIDYSKQTERALTGRNPGISGENEVQYYMLTPTQLNAIHFNNPIMVLYGDFGTGKTYVLKERAKKFAEKYRNKKIVYFNLTATREPDLEIGAFLGYLTPTVMDLIAEQYFEKYPNVRVICCKELFEYLPDHEKKQIITAADILLFVKHHNLDKVDHIFIDELHDANYSRSDLSNLLKLCRKICITLKFNSESIDKLEQWFKIVDDFKYKAALIHLTINMRNSENVVKMAKGDPVQPSSFTFLMPKKTVPGNTNYYYHNNYHLSDCSLIVAALNKYFSRDPLDSVVVLLCDDLDAKVAYNEVTKHLRDRKIVCLHPSEPIMKVKEYLKKPEGIFITNIRNFQGAQARNVIVTARTCQVKFEKIRNLILRTMSFGVYICDAMDFPDVPGNCRDTDLHDFMHFEKPPVECFHYKNKFGLGIVSLTYAFLNKYFPRGINETLVVFTFLENPLDNCLEERRRDVTIHQHFRRAIDKVDPINFLPGNVFLIHRGKWDLFNRRKEDSETSWLQDDDWYNSPLASTDNIIVFIDNIVDFNHALNCRNRIIRGRPKRAIVIHNDADLNKFVPSLKKPMLKMTEITDLHKYV